MEGEENFPLAATARLCKQALKCLHDDLGHLRRDRTLYFLRDQPIVVMRDILQSRYLRRWVAHKQLARTSLTPQSLRLTKI